MSQDSPVPALEFLAKHHAKMSELGITQKDFVLVSENTSSRVKNTACNEIDHPTTQGAIMAETTETNPENVNIDDLEVKQNFVTRTAVKFPRTARVVAITGGVVAVGGALIVGNTVRKNRAHIEAASDHAKGVLSELSDAVSPDADV